MKSEEVQFGTMSPNEISDYGGLYDRSEVAHDGSDGAPDHLDDQTVPVLDMIGNINHEDAVIDLLDAKRAEERGVITDWDDLEDTMGLFELGVALAETEGVDFYTGQPI